MLNNTNTCPCEKCNTGRALAALASVPALAAEFRAELAAVAVSAPAEFARTAHALRDAFTTLVEAQELALVDVVVALRASELVA
jgi:hypothetical protein